MAKLQDLVNLLEDPPSTPTVVLDTQKCRYSGQLSKELSQVDLNSAVSIIDLAHLSVDDITELSWFVGVPFLLNDGNIYLGVDAFNKCREIARESLLKN